MDTNTINARVLRGWADDHNAILTAQVLSKRLKMPSAAVQRRLDHLCREGLLHQPFPSKYSLTKAGKTALQSLNP